MKLCECHAITMVGDATRNLLQMMRANLLCQLAAVGAYREWIVVSNEVGRGIVPPTALGREYRDALGRTNQLLAAAAREVTLLVAGLELALKTSHRM